MAYLLAWVVGAGPAPWPTDAASATPERFLHRRRLLAIVAALLLSGCQVSIYSPTTSSAAPTRDYTVRSADSQLPPKTETVRAIDVLSARLETLGVGVFSSAAGEAITFTIPASANEMAVRAVLSTTGQVTFVPLPAAEYGTPERPGQLKAVVGKPLPSQEAVLFRGDQIADARATTNASGGPQLTIQLASNGARLFATYSSAHIGEFFAIVLDGRVVAAPVIQMEITDGTLAMTLVPDSPPMPIDALAAVLASGPLPDSWKQGP